MKYNFFVTSDRNAIKLPLCHSLVQLSFHGGRKKLAQSLKTEPVLRKLFRKSICTTLIILCISASSFAQKATWIWYPGDYEIWLSNKMQNRRTERSSFFPVFWKMDNHYVLMDFHKTFTLQQPEQVNIYAEGTYNVRLDGKLYEGEPSVINVPAGTHKINVKVFSQATVPAIFVQGKTIVSDTSWLLTYEDKEWIDETGKTSDVSATKWVNAGSGSSNDPLSPPSTFRLATQHQSPVGVTKNADTALIDFGKETFGYIQLHGIKGKGHINIIYGESKEEASSDEYAETLDRLQFNSTVNTDSTLSLAKAFRYIKLETSPGIIVDSVSMLNEYADIKDAGSFSCSDTLINKIYNVAKYTLHLATREFFIDGIKRDRWVWSGDAYQSYLMNYYLMNDNETVKRTIYALRGKDPITAHINTIMDYTFYWFLSVYDYYMYSGDTAFIKQNYPRMQTLMDYCLSRRNKDSLMEGLPGDWIFIDWATGLSKKGEVSFEQMLFCRSLETMGLCANLNNDATNAGKYNQLAADLKQKLFTYYWNEQKKALVHSRINGVPTNNVTRYANMFGIFFNYFSQQQKQEIKASVLLNDSVQKITTPYMRFYELEALCALGEQQHVLQQMKDYWGGMLQLGATSFWEEYDPTKHGAEHYAMYGRPFGKSLCHAWGASPIYLLGKYYLGVSPTSPGYTTYVVEPSLGGLQWMQGTVPTPHGNIQMRCDTKQIKIRSTEGEGTLRIKSKTTPKGDNIKVKNAGDNLYEIKIEQGVDYTIDYKAL